MNTLTFSTGEELQLDAAPSTAGATTLSTAGGRGEKRKLDSISTDERTDDASPSRQDRVCEECSKIDFGKVRNLDAGSLQLKHHQGVLISNLGNRFLSPTQVTCSLCRVFASSHITPASPHAHSAQGYKLRAYSFLKHSRYTSLHYCPKALKTKDQLFLAVVPENVAGETIHDQTRRVGLLFSSDTGDSHSHIFTPRLVPPLLDYSIVKRWLDYCRSHHKTLCGLDESQSLSLKLIDCTTLSIVCPELLPPYAALSYVWGRNGIAKYTRAGRIIP